MISTIMLIIQITYSLDKLVCNYYFVKQLLERVQRVQQSNRDGPWSSSTEPGQHMAGEVCVSVNVCSPNLLIKMFHCYHR